MMKSERVFSVCYWKEWKAEVFRYIKLCDPEGPHYENDLTLSLSYKERGIKRATTRVAPTSG